MLDPAAGPGTGLDWVDVVGLGRRHSRAHINGVDKHRFHLCGWSSHRTYKGKGAGPTATKSFRGASVRPMRASNYTTLFKSEVLVCFFVPLSIGKPTIESIGTPGPRKTQKVGTSQRNLRLAQPSSAAPQHNQLPLN